MGKVESFEKDKTYVVLQDYKSPRGPLQRLKSICYDLTAGQKLRFRGPNFGNAEFLTLDGTARLVILSPKLAFKLIGLED
jgi:hypothetical protein